MSAAPKTVIEILDRNIKVFRAEKAAGIYAPVSCMIGDIERDQAGLLPARCRERVVIVPRRLVILRQMRLPSHDQNELADMIGLRLINNIPYPMEEIIYQHQVLEQDSDGYSRVLVIIVPRSISQKYMEYARALGQGEVKLTLSSYGLLEWWSQRDRKQPAAVIDLDMRHSEICFCQEGKLYFSRNLPYGRGDVINKNAAGLIDEITASLAAYQNQDLGPVPESIIVLLPFQEGKDLQKKLEAALGIPVEVTGTIERMPGIPAAVQETLRANGQYSFTAGLGLLLSNKESLVNLVPTEVRRDTHNRLFQRRMIRLIGLVLVAGVLKIWVEAIDTRAKSKSLEVLEGQSRPLKALVRDARERIGFVAKFDRKFRNDHFVPALLEELRLLTPEEIAFRTFSIDGDGRVTIQGYAQDHAQVNQMQSGLIRSPHFQNVDLKFATNRKIAQRNEMDFKMGAELSTMREGSP